jgi:hypothetical protein
MSEAQDLVVDGRRPSARGAVTGVACVSSFIAMFVLVGCYQSPTLDDSANDTECQLVAAGASEPGYPFNLAQFESDVLPMLKASCGAAGCHGAPVGTGNFTVWADAAPGNCNYAKSFNSLAAFVDLAKPTNSAVYVAISGALATHPVSFGAGQAPHDALLAYLEDASTTWIAGGGGSVTPPPGASPFDYAVYQSTIQPMIDGCATSGCHGTGAGFFTLTQAPAANSAQMEANFIEVTGKMNLDKPETSLVYLRATTRHGGGASNVLSADQASAMLAWIQDAKQNAGDAGAINCVDAGKFDLGVFRDEILPILRGDVDLNNRNGGEAIGCTRGVCHGADRPPGSLILKDTATPETNLANFACFVDLSSASSSDVLRCPTNDPGCRRYPHPGETVLTGANDLNYQRILSYLFAAKIDAAPLDFAFFARRINPIFSDTAISDPAAGGRSCADAIACHGVSVAGQLPANGSNFPILPSASDKTKLAVNFTAAANFVNFFIPDESALFLYPTNEIANLEHATATGLPHSGGEAFAPDSATARDVLTWARGLRPDANGFQRNWLVAGDYAITRISDATPVAEATVTPTLFDPSGGRLFGGTWEGLFEERSQVDLAAAFPGQAGTGRAIYAVAYLLNGTSRSINAQLTLDSPNATKVYVDGVAVVQTDGGQASFLATLPSFRNDKRVVRLLIKVLQRPTDPGFNFSLLLRDDLGNVLGANSGVIVKLGPQGGI